MIATSFESHTRSYADVISSLNYSVSAEFVSGEKAGTTVSVKPSLAIGLADNEKLLSLVGNATDAKGQEAAQVVKASHPDNKGPKASFRIPAKACERYLRGLPPSQTAPEVKKPARQPKAKKVLTIGGRVNVPLTVPVGGNGTH